MNLPGQFMEAINGILTIVHVALLALVLRYLVKKWQVFRWKIKNYEETALGIGIAMSSLGVLLFRAPIWIVRHMENSQWTTQDQSFWMIPVIVVGTIVALIGALCLIRIMTPPALGERLWLSVLFLAFFIGVGLAL